MNTNTTVKALCRVDFFNILTNQNCQDGLVVRRMRRVYKGRNRNG